MMVVASTMLSLDGWVGDSVSSEWNVALAHQKI